MCNDAAKGKTHLIRSAILEEKEPLWKWTFNSMTTLLSSQQPHKQISPVTAQWIPRGRGVKPKYQESNIQTDLRPEKVAP